MATRVATSTASVSFPPAPSPPSSTGPVMMERACRKCFSTAMPLLSLTFSRRIGKEVDDTGAVLGLGDVGEMNAVGEDDLGGVEVHQHDVVRQLDGLDGEEAGGDPDQVRRGRQQQLNATHIASHYSGSWQTCSAPSM